jgi:tol-pal system protein YbgF
MLYQNYKNYLNKMNKKILSILFLVLLSNLALADSESYGPIIQRQSKQIQELKARTLELENSIGELKSILKNSGIIVTSKGSGSISTVSPKVPVVVPVPSSSLLPEEEKTFFVNNLSSGAAEDKIDYDLALAALKDGNFEVAETKFADFIKKHPGSSLQSNATFWYAETYYRRGVFNQAAINYLQSYKQYPKGIKAPDALLKLSYSLASLNKNKEACSMLEKLELEFPKRSISSIKRAKEARDKFRCK